MEFKSLGNIETSFKQIRLYAFVFATNIYNNNREAL